MNHKNSDRKWEGSKTLLQKELNRLITGEVKMDPGSRAMYSTDASNYRQVPIAVVIPQTVEDVVLAVDAVRQHQAPILLRGGGTSLAGQCCNEAVVIDTSRYLKRILEIDPEQKHAVVEPGIILDELRDAAERHHLTFGPDPATHSRCTLGGMIGNNSCGVHSVYSGKTDDNVEELEVLTYRGLRLRVGRTEESELQRIITEGGARGELYAGLKSLRDRYADLIRKKYPDIPRRVSGFNLNHLLAENGFHVARALVGSEGTCAIVLGAKLRLVHSPPFRCLIVLGFADAAAAGDRIMEILAHEPLAVEGIDEHLVRAMKRKNLHPDRVALLPEGGGWLFVEFGGESHEEAVSRAEGLIAGIMKGADAPSVKLFDSAQEAKRVWKVRESALGATAFVPGEPHNWEGWEDSAVPPRSVGPYLRELRALMDRYEYNGSLYGHFGQGCIHTRINFDLRSREGIGKFRSFVEEAADLVIRYGGSLSGEHGDGQSRAELLPRMFGPELVEAFREFKRLWDPDGKMNPGKVVDPYRLDENLRLGEDYAARMLQTNFHYREDHGSFADASLRCVGVGECRRTSGGLMCPSYMATLDEKHSTRGRARLLFEMTSGGVLRNGWNDEHIKEALDLCLSCKGCKKDCPVGVDMATYKAEFFSHYYENKSRPMAAHFIGKIHQWSKIAALMPGVSNLITGKRLPGSLLKAILGIDPKRELPAYTGNPFRKWFERRSASNSGSSVRRIILWPDTFTNFFHPHIARAAVHVFESAGYSVAIPRKPLCCGRPLYDFGMLDEARSLLKEILYCLQDEIQAGTPVIGLEPGCVSVFRDELPNLLPEDPLAEQLSRRTWLFSEFMEKESIVVPRIEGNALIQIHCHQRSVMHYEDEIDLLKRAGLDCNVIEPACCGMAGSFGFLRENYDVSLRVGELEVLPAVRRAPEETLIVSSGFSCREQIRQLTGRRVYHPAELIADQKEIT